MILPIFTAPQYFHDGSEAWELRPDWQTLRVCGFAPAHSSVMCFNARLGSSDPFIRCPRKLLSKVLDNFQDELESRLLMGFEIEFILLDEFSNLANSNRPGGRLFYDSRASGRQLGYYGRDCKLTGEVWNKSVSLPYKNRGSVRISSSTADANPGSTLGNSTLRS